MSGEEDIQVIQAERMRQFCVSTCKAVQLSQEHAELLTDTLIQADLRGTHSHGVVRLPVYVKGYQTGGINLRPSIKVVKESGATAVIDGDGGLGLIVSHPAMRLAMDKASNYGVGIVTVRNSDHVGMVAYWSMLSLERDMIGYATTNASCTMAPWGGVTLSHGNNPISYAIPAGSEWPIVLDIAMSVVAKGKIRLAALKNESIPEGWAMDEYGEPTTDAHSAIDGLLMPIAGHKGYGMALVNEIMCGVLSGGLFGVDMPKARIMDGSRKMGYSHFFMALNIDHFIPVVEFKKRVDKLIRMMKASRLAKGQSKIYLPGEIEFETKRIRVKEGIPYSKAIIEKLKGLAQELHLPTEF
ncbi:Ldh family oxidoreductase [Chloroflexota bacterium]